MTCTYNDIMGAYHTIRKANRPETTEEFADKMVKSEEALNELEIRKETDPAKKISAFNEVVKNQGANIMYLSSEKLAVLVSEVLRSKKSLCA